MKRFCIAFACVLTALLFAAATNSAGQHGFRVRQYESFYRVLHPLEHEALPRNDFRRIRAKSSLLVRRGNAIVKLGVPRSTSEQDTEEFAKQLNSFREALARFKSDARTGTNEQLKASYSAVHDSFEMLASLLPRR